MHMMNVNNICMDLSENSKKLSEIEVVSSLNDDDLFILEQGD